MGRLPMPISVEEKTATLIDNFLELEECPFRNRSHFVETAILEFLKRFKE